MPLEPLILNNQLDTLVGVYIHIVCLPKGSHKIVAVLRLFKDKRYVKPPVVVKLLFLTLSWLLFLK